jgi:hypothetical protein
MEAKVRYLLFLEVGVEPVAGSSKWSQDRAWLVELQGVLFWWARVLLE